VVRQLVAEEGEVVLFEGGRGEGCFRVEEAAELGDDAFALWNGVSLVWLRWSAACAGLCTLSSSSWTLASAFFSSSVGFGGMAVCVENCEYVWSDASVCREGRSVTLGFLVSRFMAPSYLRLQRPSLLPQLGPALTCC
jgi:hypothetical protein